MHSVSDACASSDAPSVNAPLYAFLQHHPPITSSCLSLEGLYRYPLPVLTGAAVTDVAGLAPPKLPMKATSYDSPVMSDRTCDVVHAVHRFWQTSDAPFPTTKKGVSSSLAAQSPSGTREEKEERAAREAAAWVALSPFRLCAQPSFHAQLRRCATLPSPSLFVTHPANGPPHVSYKGRWLVMDALCHGFCVPQKGDGNASPHRRKRLRTASASPAPTVPQEHHQQQMAGGSHSDTALAEKSELTETTRDVSNVSVLGEVVCARSTELRSRVTENDDLLEMLLGEPTTLRTDTMEENTAQRDRNDESNDSSTRSHITQNQSLTPSSNISLHEGTTQVTHGPGEAFPHHAHSAAAASRVRKDDVALTSCTVKELKDTCARFGLLSTGSKFVLMQRIQLYESSRRDAASASATNRALPPLPTTTAAVAAESQHVSQALHTLTPYGLLSQRSASGSPPRTVFRYRSPSAPPDSSVTTATTPSIAVSVGTAGTTSTDTPPFPAPPSSVANTDDHRTFGTSTTSRAEILSSTPAATSPARKERRVVPSPTAFLQQLVATHQQQLRKKTAPFPPPPARSTCVRDTTKDAPPVSSLAASRTREEALKKEVGNVRWQWLVDFRERTGAQRGNRSKHEGMIDAFRRQQVPCTSVALPCGDFMLAVELSSQESAELQAAPQHSLSAASQIVLPKEVGIVTARDAQTVSSPVLGHVCSLVVERKTVADVDASVKGSRYTEQRRLLAASPYALVVWLIEGTDVMGVGKGWNSKNSFFSRPHEHQRQEGSQGRSPVPDGSDLLSITDVGDAGQTSSPAESAQQRVNSACASLGLQQGGWMVVRTRNTAESVQFLKQLAVQVVRQLAGRRLSYREMSSDSNDLLFPIPNNSDSLCTRLDVPVNLLFRRLHFTPITTSSSCASTACLRASSFSYPSAFLQFAPTQDCLHHVSALQRRLRAQTAFPRMLMCVRGCSPGLAALLSNKYGSLLGFWKTLRRHGREACDADADIRRLSTAQKKVFILLTEFLLAKDYY